MKEPIDIVILGYKRVPFTFECINYIIERTTTDYRLTLVYNGTDDLKKDEIEALQKLYLENKVDHLILSRHNYGVHAGKNAALPLVHSYPYYIDMDNDILVPDLRGQGTDWIQEMIRLMEENDEYASISLRPQVLVGRSGKEFEVDSDVVEFSHIGAHGRIMKTEFVKAAGGWEDTWNSLRNHEDHYIAKGLAELGKKSGYAKHLRCWHMFGVDGVSDPWGYDKDSKPADHGHREIWPPVNKYAKLENFDEVTWQPKTQ